MTSLGRFLLHCALASGAALFVTPAGAQTDHASRTLGFVIEALTPAFYQAPGGSECPDGLQLNELDMFEKAYSSKEAQEEFFKKNGFYYFRGPNRENAWLYPERVTEPVPYKELKSKIGLGRNLDGKAQGNATATTCPHENFVDPAGAPGIDNQLYRVLGCHAGWKKGGPLLAFQDDYIISDSKFFRILMEVSDVDDPVNDPDVLVSVYRGRDELVRDDLNGRAVPWQTQTVDGRHPEFITRHRGSIKGGVLQTQDGFIRTPIIRVTTPSDFRINGHFEINLAGDRAEGMLVGYHDVETFWKDYRHSGMGGASVVVQTGPGTYKALKRYADGDRDPATGQCRSISAAYQIEATAVFLRHDTEATKPGAVRSGQASAN
ncbi:MAG: hypothetical protein ABI885_14045 [Gammaproteobacteria bacterium]